jgi:hypothetical protein
MKRDWSLEPASFYNLSAESMKRSLFFIIVLALSGIGLVAQSQNQDEKELQSVIQTALDYADGFYSGAPERMERAISPDINKVYPAVLPNTGKTILIYSTYSGLIEMTRAKTGFLEESSRNISTNALEINENIACVVVKTKGFNDYLTMVRTEERWKIVNVLWTVPKVTDTIRSIRNSDDSEKQAVEQAVRDYIEGIYTGDMSRIGKVLHPEYKRAIVQTLPQTNKSFIQRDGFSMVIGYMKGGSGILPREKWDIKINILDLMDGLSFVKLELPSGINYIQLAKIDGQWMIINILRKVN